MVRRKEVVVGMGDRAYSLDPVVRLQPYLRQAWIHSHVVHVVGRERDQYGQVAQIWPTFKRNSTYSTIERPGIPGTRQVTEETSNA